MMKMLIMLDEDKIRREKKYDINKKNAYLTSAFEKRGMTNRVLPLRMRFGRSRKTTELYTSFRMSMNWNFRI